jgi:hypothetical protein
MKRMVVRLVVTAALVGLGWTAGRAAQPAQADFELRVTAPMGETDVTCVRGCKLLFIRYTPDETLAQPSFKWQCGGAGTTGCVGTMHGFVVP